MRLRGAIDKAAILALPTHKFVLEGFVFESKQAKNTAQTHTGNVN